MESRQKKQQVFLMPRICFPASSQAAASRIESPESPVAALKAKQAGRGMQILNDILWYPLVIQHSY